MSLNKISGDDAWMDPPVPIPNTVVKHPEAESTCLVTGWEDRKLPVELCALTFVGALFIYIENLGTFRGFSKKYFPSKQVFSVLC